MTFIRPRFQTLRGAADNGSQLPGGGPCSTGDIHGSSWCRRTYSRIARALLALAHVVPTSGDVGFLSAGALCPGQVEDC